MQGELPEGWKLVSLGDEIFFKRYGGSTPSKSQSEYWNNGIIPWLSNTELKDDEINFVSSTCEKITQKGLDNCSASLLPKNCVLLTCTASIGKVGINEIKLATNQQFNSFQCSEEVLPKYLAFFLLTQKNNLIKLGGSTSFCHINTKNLGTLKIPLPPLPTQRQIVAVLEQAEAVKRQRHEADALTGALLQSVFFEMFGDPVRNEKGWESIQFGEIISETKNGLYKNEKFLGKGTPILRMYNIYQNRIVLDKYHLITATDDEIREYLVKPGDILFNRVNSRIWLGKCAVIPNDIGEFLFESKNIRIRLDRSKADPDYIVWFLSTPAGREEIMKRAKAAVNQSTVNNADLREFRILLPPLVLQQQFARVVEGVERIRDQQVASGKEIEGLCEGLMQRAFAGELQLENS